jgi:hypothetical protein
MYVFPEEVSQAVSKLVCASDGVTSKSFVMFASEAEPSKEP